MRKRSNREPAFVIRGQDALAVPVLNAYIIECFDHGLIKQAGEVRLAMEEIQRWQKDHIDETKLPDHHHRSVDAEDVVPLDVWKVLEVMVEWFAKNDGVADDFGRLKFVARAEELLEEHNAGS